MDPWSKGDYSRHIQEALMVLEQLPEINPPSGRVPGQGLLAIPISGPRRRRNSGENRITGVLSSVFTLRVKYRRKGAPWGPHLTRWPGGATIPLVQGVGPSGSPSSF